MKKLLSVILSIMMVAAISISFAVPAMAADGISVYSPGGTEILHTMNVPKVNKAGSNQIKGASVANGSNQFTFTYTGTGTLTGWEILDKDGKAFPANGDSSYKVISKEGNSITIEVLDWSLWETPDGYTINAVVTETTSSTGTTTPADSNTSSTSPSTGVASVAFATVAAAGAGVAALALLKKKDAE